MAINSSYNFLTLLEKSKLVSKSNLDQAVSIAKDNHATLYKILLEKKYVPEDELLKFFSNLFGYPYEQIDRATVDFKIASLVPEHFAREHFILPLFQLGNTLTIAVCNPFDIYSLEELEMMTGFEINVILTHRDNILGLFKYCYSSDEDNEGASSAQMDNLFELGMKLIGEVGNSDEGIYDLAQEAPIAKLVDTILKQSIEMKASDIHIEPEEKVVKVRFRVDGLLKDIMMPPKKLEPAIISRLKILANMDITEKRKPQDGRLSLRMKDKEIDFRVSTVATIYGEKMVLRVLDKGGSFVSMDKLGLSHQDAKTLNALIHSTAGVLVVCGPTGSGKTTTLYSALAKINSPDKNIITIEDPVEYSLPGINQIPVNTKIGVDFARGLSAVVRQDPDVIMVGEVRDFETATISIQAALTGHMVFTTLHTQNAPGAMTRLIDMGIQPFLLTSAIIGVIGQRLIRQLCPHCKRPVKKESPHQQKYTFFMEELKKFASDEYEIFRSEGCKFCDNSGYKGRIGIYEIMVLNEEIRQLVIEKASTERIKTAAIKNEMKTMQMDGFRKVLGGETTIEEIMRVLDL